MNTLVNRVQLIGQPGSDPEVKSLDGGKKMARFNLATNETYKNDKGEKVTDTQWHNIVLWDIKAELAEKYIRKGERLGIEGRLVSRNYQDKEGNTKYITEVIANEILFLHPKQNA